MSEVQTAVLLRLRHMEDLVLHINAGYSSRISRWGCCAFVRTANASGPLVDCLFGGGMLSCTYHSGWRDNGPGTRWSVRLETSHSCDGDTIQHIRVLLRCLIPEQHRRPSGLHIGWPRTVTACSMCKGCTKVRKKAVGTITCHACLLPDFFYKPEEHKDGVA